MGAISMSLTENNCSLVKNRVKDCDVAHSSEIAYTYFFVPKSQVKMITWKWI